MTRRIHLWIAAALTATFLMAALAIAAHADVSHVHTNVPLAGIAFNALD